jgi:hypothetical protein
VGAAQGLSGAAASGVATTKREALLQIEVDRLGVVVAVADRQTLARLEAEVTAAEADHEGAPDARRPDDRTSEDLRQVIEERVAAVLGRLDHLRVLVGAERQPVGPLHPAQADRLDRAGDRARVVLGAFPQRLEIGIDRPAVVVGQLGAAEVHREVLELLRLGVAHNRQRLGVLLDGDALPVPADRLRLLGQRGGSRAKVRVSADSSSGGSRYWSNPI